MRVTTAFNRVLDLPGASVASVSFDSSGLVIGLRRRARRHTCPCGASSAARYDRSRRRWRHLDFGACAVWLEAEIARLDCPGCGRVRTEEVPWARAGARHSRDFEDVIAWLAQRMDKTSVARLMRCSWESVHRVVTRVVADHLDDTRLDGLFRIGVDEISYKRGHYYLTVVADHDQGRVVWATPGRTQSALGGFFDALGERRRQQLHAVSMDMGGVYYRATRAALPHVAICFDPFHVIQWANQALEAVFATVTPSRPTETTPDHRPTRRTWRRTRYTLRSAGERLDDTQRALLTEIRRHHRQLFRAWELKEDLRAFYREVPPAEARRYLAGWCTAALRSRISQMQTLARKIKKHFDGIVAAVERGLSNSLLEGINAKIRVIQRRGYGHPNPESLAAMIYLCLGGIAITLPTQR